MPKCQMSNACESPVAYLDEKGFVYCAAHGVQRQGHCRCRKLRPAEVRKLERGETLTRY